MESVFNLKRYLIYPNEVRNYDFIYKAKSIRFWGSIEQSDSAQELKLSVRPPYLARAINDELQKKIIKLLENNGFKLLRRGKKNAKHDG